MEISVFELSEQLQSPAPPRLIDCRELEEWIFNRIEGAEWLPLSQLDHFDSEHFSDFKEKIVIYCHHGVRSLHLTQFLQHQGLNHVASLKGGIDAWSLEIDPNIPRY